MAALQIFIFSIAAFLICKSFWIKAFAKWIIIIKKKANITLKALRVILLRKYLKMFSLNHIFLTFINVFISILCFIILEKIFFHPMNFLFVHKRSWKLMYWYSFLWTPPSEVVLSLLWGEIVVLMESTVLFKSLEIFS